MATLHCLLELLTYVGSSIMFVLSVVGKEVVWMDE